MNIQLIFSLILIFILITILIIVICKYKNKINLLNNTVLAKESDIKQIESELAEYKDKLSEKDTLYNNVKMDLEKANIELDKRDKDLEEKKITIEELLSNIKQIESKLAEYKDKLSEKDTLYNNVKMDLEETKEKLLKELVKQDKAMKKHKMVPNVLAAKPEKNESIEAFNKMRNIYNDLINKCIEYELPSGKLFKNFDEFLDKIEEAVNFPLFYHKNIIALCGQFSSGKTSMINSFLGKDILPTAIEPTTAINTFVSYGEEERLFIKNNFGGETEIKKEFFKEYDEFVKDFVNDTSNNKNILDMVKYVSLNTEKLKYKNIALLDTPGYSANEEDSNMAMKGIIKADNIIWVVNMDNGIIRANDLKFLQREELNGKDILIVFNKADLKQGERTKIVEESKNQLDNMGIDYKDIVVYSSKYPEDEYYQEGKRKLFEFFESKNNSIERNYLKELYKIFNEFKDYYKNMEKDLSNYTKALNDVNKDFLDKEISGNKSIDDSLKSVNQNRDNIEKFIAELETAKWKCIDLLGDSLYLNDKETFNKLKKEEEAKLDMPKNSQYGIGNIFKMLQKIFK